MESTKKLPKIRIAETDGQGPAKRRRRPALSCVECRLRKVRCDRKEPCGACTRIGSAACTYRPKRANIREMPSTTTSRHVNAARPFLQSSTPSNGDPAIDQCGTSSTSGDSEIPQYLYASQNGVENAPCKHGGESGLITSMLERIKSLEDKAATREGRKSRENLSISAGSGTGSGQFLKAKFYGQSHWMNAIEPYDALGEANTIINPSTNRREVNKRTELFHTVSKIKRMARIIKASRSTQPPLLQGIQESVPPKEVCDKLIDGYFRTFEGVFRILHKPSFHKEYEKYWSKTAPDKPSVILKILLACAIGVQFYTGPDQPRLRCTCAKWVQAAANWLSGPHMKTRLNMAGLQIEILYLIARQVCNVDGDHVWITAGSLLRSAMHLGLHRDPAQFGQISVFHQEMRRRLWATVLEITAQSSLDMGMSPMISVDDYDTKPPSNINDEDMHEGDDAPLDVKDSTVFTDSSVQIALIETLPIRLEMIKLLNSLRFDLSYDVVLKVGNQINTACRDQAVSFSRGIDAGYNVSRFQMRMADLLLRRFVLCLHRPYLMKARKNLRYHFSRKMCLDSSLAIWAQATETSSDQEDDWTCIVQRCKGFFKSALIHAAAAIYLELMSQLEERRYVSSARASTAAHNLSVFDPMSSLPENFSTIRSALVMAQETAIAHTRNGDVNIKAVIFLACALARIDAIVSGADVEKAVIEAAKKSSQEASKMLAEIYEAENGVPINLNTSDPTKHQFRGEGADDVTGHNLPTGTAVATDDDDDPSREVLISVNDSDGAAGHIDGFDHSFGGLDGEWGCQNTDTDIDINAFLAAQSMDFDDSDYAFDSSPEWFYGINWWMEERGSENGLNGV